MMKQVNMKQRLVIGIFTDVFFPMIDGVVNVVDNYAKKLSLTADVYVFSPNYGEIENIDKFAYKVIRTKSIKLPLMDYRLSFPSFDTFFEKSMKAIKFDIIHIHSPFSVGNYGINYAKRHNIPLIATLHSQYKKDFYERSKNAFISELAIGELMRRLNRCDRLIAVNDEIADTAAKLGLSAESLQEWNHVAKISGSSTESLNKAFIKVNGILGDIVTGNGDKVSESLAQIGLTVDDLKGLNTDQAFNKIRDSLANVKDEALRVGIANQFFGDKIGSELLPILTQETSAISGLKNEARELGIITNEQAAIAGEFTDAIDSTKQALGSLAMDISVQVLPIMQTMLQKVRDEIIPTLKSWIEKWNNLDTGTKQIILTLGAVITAIGPVLSIIGKVGPILNIVSTALKAVGTSGLFAGAGLNFATLGIGALVAIIAMALFESEEFRALLVRLGETLMKLLPPIMMIVDRLMTALSPILDVLIELIIMLVDMLVPIINILLIPIINQIEFIAELLEMVAPLIEIIGKVLQAILIPAIKVLQKVLEPVMAVVQKIVEFLAQIFEWIGDLGSKMGDIAGNFKDMMGSITGNISEFASNMSKGIGDFVGNAADKVGGLFSKMGGWFGDNLNLKQTQSINSTSHINRSSNNTNNITINTTSPTFDIDSINKALGGSVL